MEEEAFKAGVIVGSMPILHDVYTWRAVYEDGQSCVIENEENSFADVDKTRTRTLFLLSLLDDSSYRVDVPEGATPVFFRRRRCIVNPMDDTEIPLQAVHCVGWESGEEAEYHFVYADGTVLITSDFQAV